MKSSFYEYVDRELEKALPATLKRIPIEKLLVKGPCMIRHVFQSAPAYGKSKLVNLLILPMSLTLNERLEAELIKLRDCILSKECLLVVISEEKETGVLADLGQFIEEGLLVNSSDFFWITCGRDQHYKTLIGPDGLEDLHKVIHDLWKGILYYDGPTTGLQQVNLELMQDECWKCHKSMITVTGLVFPDVQLKHWDNADWQYYNQLLPLSEIKGDNARSIEQFVDLLRKVDTTITPVGDRYSKTEEGSYTAARCPYCKAMRGNFYVADDRMQYLHSLESRKIGHLKYYSISLNIEQELLESLMNGYEDCEHTCGCGWKRN